ncbi:MULTISPECIES: sensor histidine kinase [Streptococcus]|uniref:Sensor histidine kinase n=1 Tax=Streptococcus caledonicus TaxID=2614158 RepID=A0ABW0UDZ6_9STRE|nr:sensor histidine kinase [Streptococcus sp. S784/96/1]
MKKQTIVMLFLFDLLILGTVSFVLFDSLGLSFKLLTSDVSLILRLGFTLLSLAVTLMVLLVLGWFLLDEYSTRQTNYQLRTILENKPIREIGETELGRNLLRLSNKMRHLTTNLQKTENAYIENSEDIVKQERRRIARDLHDTVSQELFASSMMLSGLAHSAPDLTTKQLQEQLKTVEGIVNDAQNDLRILLLHLRPTELEGKTLSEGLRMILRELTDKANITVNYRAEVVEIPKSIEENLFRIAQEFISNTLKHARADHLEVYLIQGDSDVELKMIDDGQGFDLDANRELSYGLKNIEDRVEDLAGTMKLLSSKGQGTSLDIRVPLMEGEEDGN